MRTLILLAASAMTLAASPALAQMAHDGMKSGSMAHMSAADMRRMNSCKAMSHDRMMRSPACRRMMRMHPDMMHQDMMDHGAMQGEGAMNHNGMKPGQ